MELVLLDVRLSHPHLFTARSVMGGEPRFSAAFVFDEAIKAHMAELKKTRDTIAEVLKEAKATVSPDKNCLKDGALNEKHYGKGLWYINASNEKRPQAVDKGRHPVTEEDDLFYAGCCVNAVLNVVYMAKFFRVSAFLEAVQFVRDGERIGHKPVDVNTKLPDLSGETADPLA